MTCSVDMDNTCRIRTADQKDAAAITSLIQQLAAHDRESTPLTADYAARWLANAGCGILLAEVTSEAVGLLSYSIRPNLYHAAPCCTIEELVVQDTFRGRGLGSALLQALFELAQTAGCAEVSVSTLPDNAGAIRFYRAHGLTDEAVLLEKHLPASQSCEEANPLI